MIILNFCFSTSPNIAIECIIQSLRFSSKVMEFSIVSFYYLRAVAYRTTSVSTWEGCYVLLSFQPIILFSQIESMALILDTCTTDAVRNAQCNSDIIANWCHLTKITSDVCMGIRNVCTLVYSYAFCKCVAAAFVNIDIL